MSARRQYLVCYDIRDEHRLRRVHDAMEGWGEWLQYSVFLCRLDRQELLGMKAELGDLIHHTRDSVMIVDLGLDAGRPTGIEFLGAQLRIPDPGPRII